MTQERLTNMADLVSLAKRRGFVFQSSEIYGGLNSCWDYGPLGIELKRNIQSHWWESMTHRTDIEGLDSSILMHPAVWKASGHLDGFHDAMVDCRKCKNRFKAEDIDTSSPCPSCKAEDSLTDARNFNLMFKTHIGPTGGEDSVVYLRPETAQGIFVNFSQVQATMRKKLPFGIAQIGKAFRNEISPGNFIFRMREFEQMEMQYFVKPSAEDEAMEKWKEIRFNWHLEMGTERKKLRLHSHPPDKLAHYASAAFDIEYEFPHGWGEVEGIHSRTDFDLKNHQETSGKKLEYTDQLDGNKKYLPYIVETSLGSDRCVLSIMCDAYGIENKGDRQKERTVMRFSPKVAPVKAAVLPLVKKSTIEEPARKLFEDIGRDYKAEYDSAGSIGRRYRRQDEIGTPLCITYDFDSLEDAAATVRDRDTMVQERIALEKIKDYIKDALDG